MDEILGISFRSFKIYEGRPILSIEDTSIDLLPFLLMFVFLAVAVVLFKRLKNRQLARRIVQILSAIAFAFGIHPCFCMLRNVLRGSQFISRDNLYAMGMLILFTIVVGYTLQFGRMFCGWVCPLGFFQEIFAGIGRRVFGRWNRWRREQLPAASECMHCQSRSQADPSTHCETCRVWQQFIAPTQPFNMRQRLTAVRYGILAVLFAAIIIGYQYLKPSTYVITQSIMVYSAAAMILVMMFHVADPREHRRLVYVRYLSLGVVTAMFLVGTYFNMPGCVFYCTIDDFGSMISVFAVIVGAIIVPLAWCRYVCPEGAVLGLCSKKSHWQIQRDADACVNCGKCAAACPMQAISVDGSVIDDTSCIRCGLCLEVCPVNALSYAVVPVPLPPEQAETVIPIQPSRKSPLARYAFPAALAVGAFALVGIARARLLAHTATTPANQTIERTSPPVTSDAPHAGEWRMFGHDSRHSGLATVDFPSADLKKVWTFRGGKHTWTYRKQATVWSSPVVCKAKDRWLLFVGSYDRSIYALDAETGERVWRVSAGDCVFATPALGEVDGRVIVFVAATDRKIYALDALTGGKVWAREVLEWSDTVAPSIMGSPAFGYIGDTPVLVAGVHVNDQLGPRNIQDGKVIVFHAGTGKIIWQKKLSKSPVTSPILCTIDGHAAVIALSTDGALSCLDALTGEEIWDNKSILVDLSYSSPAMGSVDGEPYIFIGTRFHTMYALDGRTGDIIWQRRANNFIDSTPAVGTVDGREVVFYGAYDRRFYCVDARSSKILWHKKTGTDICASAAIAGVKGAPVVLIHSLDDNLYMLDARTGRQLWKEFVGHVQWSHIERTDSIWSSPAVANVGGRPMLFFGSYNGEFYAFAAD